VIHRIRLTDEELSEITAALRARMSMRFDARRSRTIKLLARLEEGGVGNPNLRLYSACVHGVPLNVRCALCRDRASRVLKAAADEVRAERLRPAP
jgi:hypothetical protein